MPPDLDSMPNIHHVTAGAAFEQLGLVHRVRLPAGKGPHKTLVMVHGLNGTEDVTWIFARTADPHWLIVTPRAPFPAQDGYSWGDVRPQDANTSTNFEAGLSTLRHFIKELPNVYPVDRSHVTMLGFSQGAAMGYALIANSNPVPVRGLAALSSFVPLHLARELPPLNGFPILILHGTKDETIPIETARQNRDQLAAAGAHVTYLESEVGHKVSSAGMTELKSWLARVGK